MNLHDLLSVPDGWQPIETAPKDGTPVLLWENGMIGVFCWADSEMKKVGETWVGAVVCGDICERDPGIPRVMHVIGSDATHWMMLPAGPTPTA